MIDVTTLFTPRTAAQIFTIGLQVAEAIGLPVTSWRTGDPTRSLYKYLAEVLASLETTNALYIKAGFLSSAIADAEASGDSSWLKVLALEVYGVEAVEATFATSAATTGVVLENTGGGYWDPEPGDLTFKCSATGKTYHNTSSGLEGPLAPGATVTFEFVADEAGSASTVVTDEIDELVTTMLGVVVVSSAAAYATDEQTPASIGEQCRATLGALSPNGPSDAYEYVCRNPTLTGTTEITRAKSSGDNTTGTVTVYVAGASGPVSGGAVTLAQAAVEQWSTPLCITPTVTNATALTVNVDLEVSGDDLAADYETIIQSALGAYLATIDIGGRVARSKLIAAVHAALPSADSVDLLVPAADVVPAASEVPVAGTISATEV